MSQKSDPRKKAALYNSLEAIGKALREQGVHFLVVTDRSAADDYHRLSVDANVPDDHHMLDMLAAIMDSWRKASHD